MNVCKCGHIETGHVVTRPHTEPPTSYRGFCIISESCLCQRFVPSGERVEAPVPKPFKPSGLATKSPTAKREGIQAMLAAAAAAVQPRQKSTRELLSESVRTSEPEIQIEGDE